LKAPKIYVIENCLCCLYGTQIKDEGEIDVSAGRGDGEVAAFRDLSEGHFQAVPFEKGEGCQVGAIE